MAAGYSNVPRAGIMCCLSCGSGNQAEFSADMIIHFSGRENIDNPGVRVCPQELLVCLDCGFSRFTTPETELALLVRSVPTD